MENFKEIAEKCLAGELSGTFVLRNNDKIMSSDIIRKSNLVCSYWNQLYGFFSDNGNCYSGYKHYSQYDIINFIPDNMQKQIKIDIPEGKVPVMEQTENGVVITWKEKELTYTELLNEFGNNSNCIHTSFVNSASQAFHKKVTVLRKLTNIRNYFGKPDNMLEGWCIFKHSLSHKLYVDKEYCTSQFKVAFAKREHAEQAIKMLGDELKYLFEPW